MIISVEINSMNNAKIADTIVTRSEKNKSFIKLIT
jgi:hypothetical protein